jgi:hypothetical protein
MTDSAILLALMDFLTPNIAEQTTSQRLRRQSPPLLLMQPQQAQEMAKTLPSTIFANSPVNTDIVHLQLVQLLQQDL